MVTAIALRKLAAVPLRNKLLLAEASVWLAVAQVALKLLPFSIIQRHLGGLVPPAVPLSPDDNETCRRIRRIGWAVDTAGSHLPFELACLPRALACRQMLQNRGIQSRLHFGALRERDPNTGAVQTHAWLTALGVEVCGFPVARDCVEFGFYTQRD